MTRTFIAMFAGLCLVVSAPVCAQTTTTAPEATTVVKATAVNTTTTAAPKATVNFPEGTSDGTKANASTGLQTCINPKTGKFDPYQCG